jgi:hypothetical protein
MEKITSGNYTPRVTCPLERIHWWKENTVIKSKMADISLLVFIQIHVMLINLE